MEVKEYFLHIPPQGSRPMLDYINKHFTKMATYRSTLLLLLLLCHHCCHIIYPLMALLTKLVQPRWQDIDFILFLHIYGPRLHLGLYKHAKKKRRQYPAILTSCLVNNPYLFVTKKGWGRRRVGPLPPPSPSQFQYFAVVDIKKMTSHLPGVD